YQLDKDLEFKKNITSIPREEIDGCLTSLETLDIHEAVHDIRKRLKKLRALARLVRDEMGEENYKEINIFFRDLGRELSDLRDLTAHIETLNLLRERYGNHLYVNFFRSIIKQIESERSELKTSMIARNFFSDHLVKKLNYAKKDLIKWPVNSNDIMIILPSIERVYKRGTKAQKNAYANPNKENFHEWRKRVKYLWYQTLLLQETWPEFFNTLESEIHELSDLLGNDHDLMVLLEKTANQEIKFKDEQQAELLEAIILKYSQVLRSAAQIKGELIYAEEPSDFIKRIGRYTKANWK
ncbi:MAG: CHAD domain-containing protein, partial [Gramella sp.]|nr:CHAD domain-containing protein [Christiangramia sp.]